MPDLSPALKDIRVWIILFFLIRLYGITLPPLETAHNWRQSTVTMVARNFYEQGPDVLHPTIDIAGEKTGITGMEFPFLNYLIYLVSRIFGYHHWYGRLINLIVSSFGIWMYYLILTRFFTRRHAYIATLFLLSSMWFAYSRKIMPDTFSVSLIFIGLYCFYRYNLDHAGGYFWLLSVLFFSLGALSKIPAATLMVFALPALITSPRALPGKVFGGMGLLIALIPCLWWYFIQVPAIQSEFGFSHFFLGKPMKTGAVELLQHYPDLLRHFYADAMKYSGFILFSAGLILAIVKKNKLLLLTTALGLLAYLPVMLSAGFTFTHHSYYMIPLIPVMALGAAYIPAQIPRPFWMIFLVILVVLEGLFNQVHDFRIKPAYAAIEQLEREIAPYIPADERILINSRNVPTPMYFAHRKGWVAGNELITRPGFLDSLQGKGLKYILILKRAFAEEVMLNEKLIITNENFSVYTLCQRELPATD